MTNTGDGEAIMAPPPPADQPPGDSGTEAGRSVPASPGAQPSDTEQTKSTSETVPLPPRKVPGVEGSLTVPPVKGSITVAQQRERVREYLAKALLGILGATVLLGAALLAVSSWLELDTEAIERFFAPVFSAVVGIAGSAVGFYFGSESSGSTSDSDDKNGTV